MFHTAKPNLLFRCTRSLPRPHLQPTAVSAAQRRKVLWRLTASSQLRARRPEAGTHAFGAAEASTSTKHWPEHTARDCGETNPVTTTKVLVHTRLCLAARLESIMPALKGVNRVSRIRLMLDQIPSTSPALRPRAGPTVGQRHPDVPWAELLTPVTATPPLLLQNR